MVANMSHELVINHLDITSADVLCGRGGATNNHPGNVEYRRTVASFQEEYLRTKKRNKRDIARLIVHTIRQANGRFLKRVDEGDVTGQWVDVGDTKAVEKTSQALREGLDQRRGKSSGEGQSPMKRKNYLDSSVQPPLTKSTKTKFAKLDDCRGPGEMGTFDFRYQQIVPSVTDQFAFHHGKLPLVVSGTSLLQLYPGSTQDHLHQREVIDRPNERTSVRRMPSELVVPV